MKMKKEYIKPCINIDILDMEVLLNSVSTPIGGGADQDEFGSKDRNDRFEEENGSSWGDIW